MSEVRTISDPTGNVLAYKDGDRFRVYDHVYSELGICLLLDKLCALANHYPAKVAGESQ